LKTTAKYEKWEFQIVTVFAMLSILGIRDVSEVGKAPPKWPGMQ
jgi:hypothetical protein